MQDQVIEISLSNGATALARVPSYEDGGATKVAAATKFDFDDVSRTLEGLTEAVKSALDKVAPDKVTVELGLELAVKNGRLSGLLVEGEGKGSLGVTLEWAGAKG